MYVLYVLTLCVLTLCVLTLCVLTLCVLTLCVLTLRVLTLHVLTFGKPPTGTVALAHDLGILQMQCDLAVTLLSRLCKY